MKHVLVIIFCFVIFSFISEKKIKHVFETETTKFFFETSNGRMDGQYISYYKNGKKKAEGKFENNYRKGVWTVWDSTGRIRMQRDYSDPFTFKRLIPAVPNNKVIELLNSPAYMLKYNKEGVIEYFFLRERAVVWAKLVWRFVTPINNPILFENNKLFSIINKNILNKNIKIYQATDDQFTNELLPISIDTNSFKIIGFKTKEDIFFDNERLVLESRILGICPVVIHKLIKDTIDMYWVPYQQIRKYFAQEKVQQVGLPAKIKTLDELFFYRFYYGQIIMEANAKHLPISSYKTGKDIEKEALEIELNIIENEHDIWISFTE